MQITNGTRLFIGTRVASKSTVSYNDYVHQDGYWREVGGLTSIGGIGDTIELIAQPSIGMGRQLRVKGTRSGNQSTYQFIRNKLDAGQNALIDAGEECGAYAFKVEWLQCGDDEAIETAFFYGLVLPNQRPDGDASVSVRITADVAILSNILNFSPDDFEFLLLSGDQATVGEMLLLSGDVQRSSDKLLILETT